MRTLRTLLSLVQVLGWKRVACNTFTSRGSDPKLHTSTFKELARLEVSMLTRLTEGGLRPTEGSDLLNDPQENRR